MKEEKGLKKEKFPNFGNAAYRTTGNCQNKRFDRFKIVIFLIHKKFKQKS